MSADAIKRCLKCASTLLHDIVKQTTCRCRSTVICCQTPGKSFVNVGRYKNYAKHLITRVNTINGRKYSEDDTIFGVQTMFP